MLLFHFKGNVLPQSPPILCGKQKCSGGNSWVLFPSKAVSVSHQIKAVINKNGPPGPLKPILTFPLYTAFAAHACLLVAAPLLISLLILILSF